MAALGAGATANSACRKWRHHHNAALGRFRVPVARPYLACARFKFRNSRIDGARFGADVPVGIAGRRGPPTPLQVDASSPALLARGASDSLGNIWDPPRNYLHLEKLGAAAPWNVYGAGHYVSDVASFDVGGAPPLGRGAIQSASSFSPDFEDGPRQFAPPGHLEVREAVALKNAREARATFAVKLHPNWGRAPAHQLKRFSLDAERTNRKRLGCLEEAVSQCEVC